MRDGDVCCKIEIKCGIKTFYDSHIIFYIIFGLCWNVLQSSNTYRWWICTIVHLIHIHWTTLTGGVQFYDIIFSQHQYKSRNAWTALPKSNKITKFIIHCIVFSFWLSMWNWREKKTLSSLTYRVRFLVGFFFSPSLWE